MTHCERVLELLSDGREHSHHELYALNVVAHSRISELRERGHLIDQRRVVGSDGEPDYIYSLRDATEQDLPGPAGPVASRSEVGTSQVRLSAEALAASLVSDDSDEQLVMDVAA